MLISKLQYPTHSSLIIACVAVMLEWDDNFEMFKVNTFN